jgi:hypothetical protein
MFINSVILYIKYYVILSEVEGGREGERARASEGGAFLCRLYSGLC